MRFLLLLLSLVLQLNVSDFANHNPQENHAPKNLNPENTFSYEHSYELFRYYSPEEGMYISQDPIGLAGNNPTLYAYVHDPNSWVYVFGLECKKKGKGEYKDVGGHHIHAKSGFKDNMNYDPNKGFYISHNFMKEKGWLHQAMTNKQRELSKELANSGRPNTIFEHNKIAVESLRVGGATKAEARSLVAESVVNLRKQGATTPTNIPWKK